MIIQANTTSHSFSHRSPSQAWSTADPELIGERPEVFLVTALTLGPPATTTIAHKGRWWREEHRGSVDRDAI